jgi:hypothetical protein
VERVKAVIKVRLKLKVYSERRNLEKVKTREIMSQPGTDNLGCDSVRYLRHVQNVVPVKAGYGKVSSQELQRKVRFIKTQETRLLKSHR